MDHLFNHHTHTYYCDGTGEPEEYVQAALQAGFHTLGFSSHAPVPFKNAFAIQSEEDLAAYCQSIRALKEKYEESISILLALEIDYIRGKRMDFQGLKEEWGLDYTIGSVHLVRSGTEKGLWFIDGPKVEKYDRGLQEIFDGDIKRGVRAYFEQTNQMILTQKPDIVGHMDKVKMHNQGRYFQEDEPWYKALWMETLELIRQSELVIEANTRGIYKGRSDDLYPGRDILRQIHRMKIPLTLSSDAHKPEEIGGYYPESLKVLKEIGFEELWYFSPDSWKSQAI